jgi:ABC-type amino acid transport substrate-binding protein
MASRVRLPGLSFLIACLAVLLPPSAASAQQRDLILGTREVPPFAMLDEEGQWHGISVDLWRLIAEELDLRYRFQPMGLAEMVDSVSAGTIDGAVAALSMTADREARLDFSHPFFASGLAIAVPRRAGGPFHGIGAAVFSADFVKALGGLLFLLMLVGLGMWLLERRRNPDQFGGNRLSGLGSGFWWAAVTMTTVGYGDKAPVSAAGRTLGFVWMFAGVITISGFTAAIASALTASHLAGDIQGPADLVTRRVATVSASAPATALRRLGIQARGTATLEEALADLARGRLDAVVYDAPLLLYVVGNEFDDALTILPGQFEEQSYAIALRPQSPLREAVNRALLRITASDAWDEIITRYGGTLTR